MKVIPNIFIKNIQSGKIREFGRDRFHDRLRISEDGRCLYYENMQDGDGSSGGDYRFVIPEVDLEDKTDPDQYFYNHCIPDSEIIETLEREIDLLQRKYNSLINKNLEEIAKNEKN